MSETTPPGEPARTQVPAWTPDDDKALHEGAKYLSTAHLSFIAVSVYLALAAWQTTHQQLLLGASFSLPVLNVPIDLVTFYTLGPWLYVLLHATLLTQLRLFARRAFQWSAAHDQNRDTELPLGLSPLLYYLLLQRMALSRLMLATAVGTTLLIGPLLLLWLFQVRFLAYHDGTVTMWQRAAIFADAAALLLAWPQIVSRRMALAARSGTRRGRLRRFARAWLAGFNDERLGCTGSAQAVQRARRRTLRTIALSIVLPLPLLLALSGLFRDAGDADGLLLCYLGVCLGGLASAYWQVRVPAGRNGGGNDDAARSPFVLSYATIIATASVCTLSLFTLVPTVDPDACLPQPGDRDCAPLEVANGRAWLEPLLLHVLAAVSGRRLLLPGQIEELNYQLLGPPDADSGDAARWQPGWCAWLDVRPPAPERAAAIAPPPPPPRRCGRLGPVPLPTALLFEPDLQRGNAGDTRRRLLPSRYLHLRGAALDQGIKPEDVASGDAAGADGTVCARAARRAGQPFDPGEKRIWQFTRALRVQFRDLAGADLRDASMPLGQFQTVSFFGAMLDGAYLNGTQLHRVDLRHASLTWSHLDNSDWDGVQADFSTLDHADLRCARLGHVDLVGARLIAVGIAALELERADLRGALLVNAVDAARAAAAIPASKETPAPERQEEQEEQEPRTANPCPGTPDGSSVLAGLAVVDAAAACRLLAQGLPPCRPPAATPPPDPAPPPVPTLYGLPAATPADAARAAAALACADRSAQFARHANALVLMAPPFAAGDLGQPPGWSHALFDALDAPLDCPARDDPLLRARRAIVLGWHPPPDAGRERRCTPPPAPPAAP